MTRKAARNTRAHGADITSSPNVSRRSGVITAGALIASAAFSGMGVTPAAASDLNDPRLNVIGQALAPRLRDLIDLGRQHPAQQPATAAQAKTFDLNIADGPLGDVAAALARATGASVDLSIDSIAPIHSPGVSGTLTLEQALKAVLDGTNVVARQSSPTAVVLSLPSMSESVSVTARSAAVVSSPRYNIPVRDIPQTIEVIPRAAMEAQGVTTLSEALRNVPGITLQAGEGGGASSTAGDMFNMRGFNAANSLFVDNVRDDGLISRDVYNLEQVEVYMGPTGSDVGRGTAAGYVNMQTKTPHMPQSGSAIFSYGSADQRRATLDFNQPLSNGRSNSWLSKSAFRMNAMWQNSGLAGRDEAKNESKAFAPSIGLGIGTATRVIASAQILRQDNLPDYGIPSAAWHDSLLTPTTVQASRPVDQSNFYGSRDVDYDRADQNTLLARVEHNITPRWLVTNQTRYNKTEREAVVSSIGAFAPATETVTISRQANLRENQITSNQTTVSGRAMTGRIEHNITSGFEFARESQFSPSYNAPGTRGAVSIYSPNPSEPIIDFALRPTGAVTDGSTNTQALYAFDSLSLGPRVQVNGGLRFEHYTTEYRAVDATNVVTTDATGSDNLLSGKVGVVYRVSPNANLYASYGTTITPPGSANFALSTAPNNQNNPNVDPQESSNVEVGTKIDLAGGRLSLTGAVFHTINKNVLFTVDAVAVPPIFNQDDKQQVDGVTLGATGQITSRWQVLASFGYLDTESLTQNGTNNGKRLILSPEFSGSVWSTYALPKGWMVGGGVRGTSSVYFNAANTIQAPGYNIVDGLVQYTLNQHLTLRMNVYNLTDKVYIRNINNNGARYNPGYSRTAQLTSVVAF